jgi:uncharacterized repeat protein (TIGR03803 family)
MRSHHRGYATTRPHPIEFACVIQPIQQPTEATTMPKKKSPPVSATALCVSALLAGAALPAHAQSYTTVYQFTGGADGALPNTSLTFDADGNAYGGTEGGGDFCEPFAVNGCGTIYKIDSTGHFTTLITFNSANGALAGTRLLLAGDTLYGGTQQGGTSNPAAASSIVSPLPGPTGRPRGPALSWLKLRDGGSLRRDRFPRSDGRKFFGPFFQKRTTCPSALVHFLFLTTFPKRL